MDRPRTSLGRTAAPRVARGIETRGPNLSLAQRSRHRFRRLVGARRTQTTVQGTGSTDGDGHASRARPGRTHRYVTRWRAGRDLNALTAPVVAARELAAERRHPDARCRAHVHGYARHDGEPRLGHGASAAARCRERSIGSRPFAATLVPDAHSTASRDDAIDASLGSAEAGGALRGQAHRDRSSTRIARRSRPVPRLCSSISSRACGPLVLIGILGSSRCHQ